MSVDASGSDHCVRPAGDDVLGEPCPEVVPGPDRVDPITEDPDCAIGDHRRFGSGQHVTGTDQRRLLHVFIHDLPSAAGGLPLRAATA